MKMSKQEILEVYLKQMEEALEWSLEDKQGRYFKGIVDGMTTITRELLNIVTEEENDTIYSAD